MFKDVGAFDEIPKEDLLRRIDGLRYLMQENNIDFALILENVDRFYFSGTMQKGILIIPVDQEPILFIERNTERAQMETPLTVRSIKSDNEVKEILNNKNILKGTAGLELDVLPVSIFERLKRVMGVDRCADVAPFIKELRAVKSIFELEQIKKSGQIVSHVFSKANDVIREGVTELYIDATLAAEGRKIGHQGFLRMRGINQEMVTITAQAGYTGAIHTYSDMPIAGVGVTPAVPQGSSFKRVEKGIPVTVDYGGGYNGYVTDETRVFVVGELNENFKKPYDIARRIIEDVAPLCRDGVNCTEVFSKAYKIAKNAGLEDNFMGYGEGKVSFVGHGLGLEVNELPFITSRHTRTLKEGMVFAFEPKFIIPSYGAIGIEIDLIVRANGPERVTKDSLDIKRI